jgi:endoribonuclease Dicer
VATLRKRSGEQSSPIICLFPSNYLVRIIESNLDCSIRTPRRHTHELASFVYRPIFKHVLYTAANWFNPPYSANLSSLEDVVDKLNIEDDPYVQSLRQELAKHGPGSERTRIDQTLSKTISKGKTYTQRGLKEFVTAAGEISMEIGPWAADWYVSQVIEHAKAATGAFRPGMNSLKGRERSYLLSALDRVVVKPVSYDPQDIVNGCSDKLRVLVECLEAAKADAEAHNDAYSGLVFVTRRDTVLALAKVISLHPRTLDHFNVGHLLGTSESRYRQSFLDITRKQFGSQDQTLMDFKIGEKNLIISTSVAEEGIDIQSCCSVIRWDPAPNMVSLAQSRGRARQQRSTFIAMYSNESGHEEELRKWENLEMQMVSSYNDAERERVRERERAILEANAAYDDEDDDDDDDHMVLRVESTG